MRRVIPFFSFYLVCITAIASPAQTFTSIYSFCPLNNYYCPDGSSPDAPVVQGNDGSFYGTTAYGGAQLQGTVFKITPQGTLTTLHNFCSEQYCADGQTPLAGLVQATDGNFYGATYDGGPPGANGTVFRVTPEGILTTLHGFQFYEGYRPNASLIQATDGSLYGATGFGGAHTNGGSIFKITLEGGFTVVYSFCAQNSCTDGRTPNAALIQASDGNFYGTTGGGGINCVNSGGCGTVFKITPQGALTTIYSFCAQNECADGSTPYAALVQGSDGNFYGTTNEGGANCKSKSYCGTIFRITPQGTLTTLHSFSGSDGELPSAGLVQGSDGNLYGTTPAGGSPCSLHGIGGCGTIFRITPEGVFTSLYSFSGPDGASPEAALTKAADGSLYGTTANGGANCSPFGGCGTVFHIVAYDALSVNKSGPGTVIAGNGKIYCGDVCSYVYDIGTEVGLTAIPAPGYTFASWTGCDNAQGSFCTITMSSAKNVTATFTTSNVGLTSLVLNPSSVKGGNISIATITLNAPAPPGGLSIGVATSSPLAVHPPSQVTIPPGVTSYSFPVRTSPVRTKTVANVIASAGTSQVTAPLTVTTGYGSAQEPSEPQR